MVSPRVGVMQLHKLCKHASELEQSGGRRAWRWPEVAREGEGRSYHDIPNDHELAGSLSILNGLSSNKLRCPRINVRSSSSY